MTFFKKLIVALMATMTMAVAGGNIAPVAEPVVIVEQSKDFYVGLSTTISDSIVTSDFDTFSSTGYGAQAGYTFYRNGAFDASVEARYMAIVTGSVDNFDDYQTYGAYLKPRYDFGAVAMYGLIGYSAIDTINQDSDGFAYGAGLSTNVYGTELFIDYVTNDDNEFSGLQDGEFNNEIVTVGFNYRF